jgi:single-stranded-DNA-specific exonuclease
MTFHGMREASERIKGAVYLGERICVYGDYDCDGVTSTALLVSCLGNLGANVCYYIPNRFAEGYGMHSGALDKLKEAGVDLILTVDNGISAKSEVDYALGLGMDIIVTDHHAIPDAPLPNVITVNPHLSECGSRFKEISGVGVAFYLACALTGTPPEAVLENYADIVALGSVADVMPLVMDNRVFVIAALRMLKEDSACPGVKALLEVSKADGKTATARTFGFALGPRVNAAGRMGDASPVVDMLLTHSYDLALAEARQLDALNAERKRMEEIVLKEIETELASDPQILRRRVIVVCGEGWHQGVIGIVAARMVEHYGKPCIVFTTDGEIAHGSGRSTVDVSLIDALSACKGCLIRCGGHRQAVGLTAATDMLEALADALDEYLLKIHPVMAIPSVRVDAEISVDEMSIANIRALSYFEPYGEGNPAPMFAVMAATVVDFDSLSQGKHTKVHFRKSQKTFSALYFQMAPGDFPYRANDVVDVLVQFEVGEYRGEDQLSVFVRDIKPHGFDAGFVAADFEAYSRHQCGKYEGDGDKATLLPTKENIAVVFRMMRERALSPTSPEFAYISAGNISFRRILVTFDVMAEMGLIKSNGGNFLLADVTTKRNLAESRILRQLSKKEDGL